MEKNNFEIIVYTENNVGLLNRISTIFSRRKINIESLHTTASERAGVHRFNIVVCDTEETIKKVSKQIEKQIEVFEVSYRNIN